MYSVEIYDPVAQNTIELVGKVMSIQIDEKLGSNNNTASITVKGAMESQLFREIIIKKDDAKVFGGYIVNQTMDDVIVYKTIIKCSDYNWILQNRVIAETFENQKPSEILSSIAAMYPGEISDDYITENPLVISAYSVVYKSASEAIRKLIDMTQGWHYYIDADRKMHYFSAYETDGLALSAGVYQEGTLSLEYLGEAVANRLWIIGAKLASAGSIDQYFTCDGKVRHFSLAYEPNYVSVELDGASKTIKMDSNDDGLQDFLYNKKNRVIIIPDNVSTPWSGELKVTYRPTKQVIDYFEKPSNLLLEKAIVNKDVTDKATARLYGRSEIKKVSTIRKQISFSTREDFRIGERVKSQIPDVAEEYYLVTSVSKSVRPGEEISQVKLEEMI